jgi:hypothetical protein
MTQKRLTKFIRRVHYSFVQRIEGGLKLGSMTLADLKGLCLALGWGLQIRVVLADGTIHLVEGLQVVQPMPEDVPNSIGGTPQETFPETREASAL